MKKKNKAKSRRELGDVTFQIVCPDGRKERRRYPNEAEGLRQMRDLKKKSRCRIYIED